MNSDDFREKLLSYVDEFKRTLATDDGDWVVKGFIDYRRKRSIFVSWGRNF
jgi:hypothetical protein